MIRCGNDGGGGGGGNDGGGEVRATIMRGKAARRLRRENSVRGRKRRASRGKGKEETNERERE